MGTKVVIAMLVAVVALFVVAVVVGSRDRDGDAGADQKGPIGSLIEDFRGRSEVPLDQLTTSCGQQDAVLIVNGACRLRVPPAEEQIRTVRLTPLNAVLRVDAPVPDPEDDGDPERASTSVDPADPDEDKRRLTVAVGPRGAFIELSCLCQLRIGG